MSMSPKMHHHSSSQEGVHVIIDTLEEAVPSFSSSATLSPNQAQILSTTSKNPFSPAGRLKKEDFNTVQKYHHHQSRCEDLDQQGGSTIPYSGQRPAVNLQPLRSTSPKTTMLSSSSSSSLLPVLQRLEALESTFVLSEEKGKKLHGQLHKAKLELSSSSFQKILPSSSSCPVADNRRDGDTIPELPIISHQSSIAFNASTSSPGSNKSKSAAGVIIQHQGPPTSPTVQYQQDVTSNLETMRTLQKTIQQLVDFVCIVVPKIFQKMDQKLTALESRVKQSVFPKLKVLIAFSKATKKRKMQKGRGTQEQEERCAIHQIVIKQNPENKGMPVTPNLNNSEKEKEERKKKEGEAIQSSSTRQNNTGDEGDFPSAFSFSSSSSSFCEMYSLLFPTLSSLVKGMSIVEDHQKEINLDDVLKPEEGQDDNDEAIISPRTESKGGGETKTNKMMLMVKKRGERPSSLSLLSTTFSAFSRHYISTLQKQLDAGPAKIAEEVQEQQLLQFYAGYDQLRCQLQQHEAAATTAREEEEGEGGEKHARADCRDAAVRKKENKKQGKGRKNQQSFFEVQARPPNSYAMRMPFNLSNGDPLEKKEAAAGEHDVGAGECNKSVSSHHFASSNPQHPFLSSPSPSSSNISHPIQQKTCSRIMPPSSSPGSVACRQYHQFLCELLAATRSQKLRLQKGIDAWERKLLVLQLDF